MIAVEGIAYSVKGKKLVDDISVRVKAGKMLVIIGPNGAGKSTFLKLLTRELFPTSGSVSWQGRDLKEYTYPELARKRAVLTQQNSLSLPFEVREVVMMGRYPFHQNAPTEKDYQIVETCLRRVDLLHFADRLYPTLSGGEQQRVQLAKALAQIWNADTSFLFLDEPTNGMDLRHQYLSLGITKELTSQGLGVVAVLHDLNMAWQFADEVLILHKGRVAASGKPEEVLTATMIKAVFGVSVQLVKLPGSEDVVIVPIMGQMKLTADSP